SSAPSTLPTRRCSDLQLPGTVSDRRRAGRLANQHESMQHYETVHAQRHLRYKYAAFRRAVGNIHIQRRAAQCSWQRDVLDLVTRSEEHTSELQSRDNL